MAAEEKLLMLQSNVSCQDHQPFRWTGGRLLHKYLNNVKIRGSRWKFNYSWFARNVFIKLIKISA